MKKVVLFFAVIIAASAMAKPSPSPLVNEKIMSAFEKRFEGATNVTWVEEDYFLHAMFKFNNQPMQAWYTAVGEVEAVQRSIQIIQMTFTAAETVEKLMLDKTLLALAEIGKQNEFYYLAKIEENKGISVYKIYASGEYIRIHKTKKKNI